MKKILSLIIALVLIITAFPLSSIASGEYAITMTPEITDATYSYLNEIYIEKFPGLGLEFSFGTDADKAVLQKLADILTENCRTDEEKANAVVGWADRNVQYKSYVDRTYYFPIDVFYYRTGNCLGLGLFISQVLRLAGVPAVFCAGSRGDMRDFIKLENREIDHGWVMVYYNNTWNLYDPLFDVYGTSDREFISRWYFTDFIEGVSPYYEGMNCNYVYYGDSIFYIDGRFIHYTNGMPSSEFHGNGAEGGSALNGSVPYFTKNRYLEYPDGTRDGFNYIENPERKDSMINDECYSDGWITYGSSAGYYAKQNGILAGCTIMECGGKTLFLPFGSSALQLTGKSSDYTLTEGALTYKPGESFEAPKPMWTESELENGRTIVYESLYPEIATISDTGVITGLKDGFAVFTVASKNEEGTQFMSNFIEVYISSEERIPDYSDNVFNTVSEVKVLTESSVAAKADTSISQLLSEMPDAKVTDVNGETVEADKKLGSGMTVTLPRGESYTVVIKGDLDSNGEVSASDARLTLRASVGLETNSADWFKEAGNVEIDENEQNLTASDARLILRGSVGLENKDDWFNSIA